MTSMQSLPAAECDVCGQQGAARRRECAHMLCMACSMLSTICCAPGCTVASVVECQEPVKEGSWLQCYKCGIHVPLMFARHLTCPHSIWSQITSGMVVDTKLPSKSVKTPAKANGRDVEVQDTGYSIMAGADFMISRTPEDHVCVRWCVRNLVLLTASGEQLRLLRGMNNHVLHAPWPHSLTIMAPVALVEPQKLGPCQTIRAVLAAPDYACSGGLLLFSTDYQYLTHPCNNSHYNTTGLIGSAPLDTHPSVLVIGNGLQCRLCARIWPNGPGSARRFVRCCAEPGIVVAHLAMAQEMSSKVRAPHINPATRIDGTQFDAIVSSGYTVTRFGRYYALPDRELPAGCIAALCRAGSGSMLGLFVSPEHRACVTLAAATSRDVACWIAVVHNRSLWPRPHDTSTDHFTSLDGLWVLRTKAFDRVTVAMLRSDSSVAETMPDAWSLQFGTHSLSLRPFAGARGTFANVLSTTTDTGARCVLRIAHASTLHMASQMTLEARLLENLSQHPNILHQLCYQIKSNGAVSELVQLLEHAGQPILSVTIDETALRAQFRAILEFLDQQNIVHCDITTANVMARPEDMVIKLVDFGSARCRGTPTAAISVTCPIFRAPEGNFDMLADCPYDVWSAALVMMHVLRGYSLLCMPAELRDPRMSQDQCAFMAACLLGRNSDVLGPPWTGMLRFNASDRTYADL